MDPHPGQRHVQLVVVRSDQDFQGALHQPGPVRAVLSLRICLRLRLRLHLHLSAGDARQDLGGDGQVFPRLEAGRQAHGVQGRLLNVPLRVSMRAAHFTQERASGVRGAAKPDRFDDDSDGGGCGGDQHDVQRRRPWHHRSVIPDSMSRSVQLFVAGIIKQQC